MRGALQIVVLMFSALRLQRLALWAGASLLLVGLFLPLPAKRFLVVPGLALAIVPTLLASGVLLRSFIAPRQMRLVPRAREQVLCGMLLATLTITTVATLAIWTLGVDANVLPAVWLRIAAASSVVLVTQFFLLSSVPGVMLWFALIGVVALSPTVTSTRDFFRDIGQNPHLLVAIVAISWTAFAVWFLRVRSIKAVNDPNIHGNRVLKVSHSQATALRAFLFGNPSVIGQFGGGFFAVAMVALFWGFASLTAHSAQSVAEAVMKSVEPALLLGAYAGMGGFLVVRRSRLLWLRGARDRLGLFRACEAHAWAYYGAIATSLLVLMAVAHLIVPSLGGSYMVKLTLNLCAGVITLYLGLMHVRGWRVLDIVGAAVQFCVWVTALTIVPYVMNRLWTFPLIVVAMLIIALVLRLIALHRWRRIDWLVCKPPPPIVRGAHVASSRA